ncbi:hypothetical protein [Methylotenera mobilis]|uniref:hypothetical protein n=1 Tax=Methylotenera mobilis TaxID=359408 RepID=UPI000376823B|nr:hypothetical protein [Methylotenera mobilis]
MNQFLNDVEINKDIQKQIIDYKFHIKAYQKTLNNEGVWLFLAALGCLGVPDKGMQNVAFYITLIVFFYRLYLQLDDKRSFKEIANDIELEIASSSLANDIKKARYYDLNKLKRKELSFFKTLKSGFVFLICFIFTIFSHQMSKSM